MYLIVGATPGSGWQFLVPLLKHLCFSIIDQAQLERWQITASGTVLSSTTGRRFDDNRRLQAQQLARAELLASCQSPTVIEMTAHQESLEHWLAMASDSRLLVCYSRPELAILQAMARQQTPEYAVDTWLAATQNLLHVLRRHRQQTLVVNVEHALAAPNAFLHALCQFLGDDGAQPWRGDLELPSSPENDFLALVAAQTVAQSPFFADLLNELEASAPPIGGVSLPPLIDCTRVWNDHKKAIANLDALEAERQTLKTQLEQVTSDNELLLKHLHQVQEQLEIVYLDAKTQKDELIKQQEELKQETQEVRRVCQRLEREQDALLSSLSWRITSPFRWLLRPIMGAPFQKKK